MDPSHDTSYPGFLSIPISLGNSSFCYDDLMDSSIEFYKQIDSRF
jgi:hypothetical protein